MKHTNNKVSWKECLCLLFDCAWYYNVYFVVFRLPQICW